MVQKCGGTRELDKYSWGNPIMGAYITGPFPLPQGFVCLGKESGAVCCSGQLL